MLLLKQPLILPFLCHKSATTCQIDSYKISNRKLKRDLCNCVKTDIIVSKAPPQFPYKRSTILSGHPEKCKSSLAIIWLQESLTCSSVCLFINLCFML